MTDRGSLKDYGETAIDGRGGHRVGWQDAGQPNGVGWVALVTKSDSGYRVSSCKYQGFTHG